MLNKTAYIFLFSLFFKLFSLFLKIVFVFVGSPADKADLEIGDEILEVNGKSLDGATHTEVISHIHQVRRFWREIRTEILTVSCFVSLITPQCIRSRTICLRVKRKSGNKLGELSALKGGEKKRKHAKKCVFKRDKRLTQLHDILMGVVVSVR